MSIGTMAGDKITAWLGPLDGGVTSLYAMNGLKLI